VKIVWAGEPQRVAEVSGNIVRDAGSLKKVLIWQILYRMASVLFRDFLKVSELVIPLDHLTIVK